MGKSPTNTNINHQIIIRDNRSQIHRFREQKLNIFTDSQIPRTQSFANTKLVFIFLPSSFYLPFYLSAFVHQGFWKLGRNMDRRMHAAPRSNFTFYLSITISIYLFIYHQTLVLLHYVPKLNTIRFKRSRFSLILDFSMKLYLIVSIECLMKKDS